MLYLERVNQQSVGIKKLRFNTSALLLLVFLSVNSFFCKAQLDASVYQDFTQTLVNPYLINPAATDTTYSFKLLFNNINELGLLKNVSRFYLDADKRFGSVKNNGIHYAGVQMTNSKLGDYISKSRLQFRYSWYTRLTRKSALSAGVSLGFINYSFQTTQGGTGGSDYGPDGSIGVHYIRPKVSVGFGMQQVFTPVLMPVNQSFVLKRLYNIDLAKKFVLSPQFNLDAQFVVQLSEEEYAYSINLMAQYMEIGLIGLSNYYLKKTSVSAGIKHSFFQEYNFMLLASYSFYHTKITVADNTFELFLALSK